MEILDCFIVATIESCLLLFTKCDETVENAVHSNMLNIISFIAIKLLGDLAENLSV